MAYTADTDTTRTQLGITSRRVGRILEQVAAQAVAAGRSAWVRRREPEEVLRRRWTIAALLVLVGVVSSFVVPGADAGVPQFDSASVVPSADPPVGPAETAAGPGAGSAGEPVLQPVNVPLPLKPTVPVGKGMWLHRMERANGGDVASIVSHAQAHGLTHLYVRLGSSRMGFYAQRDLDRLLPAAHAAGLKVVGWDFPYLGDVAADADRAAAEIAYTTPDGHRIDAFSADIETPSEGTNLTVVGVQAYGQWVRNHAGPSFPLIAAVPRPNPKRWYPYAEVVAHFDAIAPMVYWINRDPATDVANAIRDLAPYGKPILPVGQAYDPAIDGSHSWEPPSAEDLHRFMRTAGDHGVAGYSFWVWDTASAEQWQAIRESNVVELQPVAPGATGDNVAALQRVLNGLGQGVPIDGSFGHGTKAALIGLQRQLGVSATGVLDRATLLALKTPR